MKQKTRKARSASRLRAAAMAMALSLVGPVAQAQQFIPLHDLPDVKPAVSMRALAPAGSSGSLAAGIGTLPAHRLNNNLGGAMLNLQPAANGGAAFNLRIAAESERTSLAIGRVNDVLFNLPQPPLREDLLLPGQDTRYRLWPKGGDFLNLLGDHYRNLRDNELQNTIQPSPLDLGKLKEGVQLPNKWIFRFFGQNNYGFVSPNGSDGLGVEDDPHFTTDLTGDLTRRISGRYGDFLYKDQRIILPSKDYTERVFVLATSTGGNAANGWGLPLEVYIISDHCSIYVSGLNTPNPTGWLTRDPVFVYRALRDRILGSPMVFWDEQTGEVRTDRGRRPAPSPEKSSYAEHVPALARDGDATLYDGQFRLVTNVPESELLDQADLEFGSLYNQALAGTLSKIPGVADSAREYLNLARPFTGEVVGYSDQFKVLVAELEKIREQLTKITLTLSENIQEIGQIDSLREERRKLESRADEISGSINRIKRSATRQPPQHR